MTEKNNNGLGEERSKIMNLKLKHYIATHTFHSSDALKGFKKCLKTPAKILRPV